MNPARQIRRWHRYPDAGDLTEHAATAIQRCAEQAIERTGAFRIVLAGGDTPRAVYRRLLGAGTRWRAWHVYFGDERCLPPDHADRNDRMVRDAWLARVPIPPEQIHAMPAELGPERAAAQYAELIRPVMQFDLVLLGLGEDGHTASLFPGHPLGESAADPEVLAVRNAPKPPAERVSLGARRLSRARQALFLVCGGNKAAAVERWAADADIPAARITPRTGVDVLADASALPLKGR